jgi:hypothetical protein
MTASTCSTTVGVFDTRAAAEQAVADLRAAGYRDDQIGLVARDDRGTVTRVDSGGNTYAGEGGAIGVAAGTAGGALVGAGVMAGVIPVVGPVLAIGTLGTILLNAVGGAAIGGLAGSLVGLGIPEEDAAFYQDEVKAGRYVVTVDCGYGDDARDVISRHGGYNRMPNRAPVM